jgi:hypothetical protein
MGGVLNPKGIKNNFNKGNIVGRENNRLPRLTAAIRGGGFANGFLRRITGLYMLRPQ